MRILAVDGLELLADAEEVLARRGRLALEEAARRRFGAVQRLEEEGRPRRRVHAETQRRLQHLALALAVAWSSINKVVAYSSKVKGQNQCRASKLVSTARLAWKAESQPAAAVLCRGTVSMLDRTPIADPVRAQ